jgi:hypothetical protein
MRENSVIYGRRRFKFPLFKSTGDYLDKYTCFLKLLLGESPEDEWSTTKIHISQAKKLNNEIQGKECYRNGLGFAPTLRIIRELRKALIKQQPDKRTPMQGLEIY